MLFAVNFSLVFVSKIKILKIYEINDDRLQKIWSIVFESRIFRIIWSFTEFIKSSDDSNDSFSFMRRFIISVISSVLRTSSILSFLRNDLNWLSCFLFLILHCCFQWSILWQSKHSELIVEHFFFEWLTRSHLVHFLSSLLPCESFFLFSSFLSLRLLFSDW